MIARLVWSYGRVAVLHDNLQWTVEPEDHEFQAATQDLFDKVVRIAAAIGSDTMEVGLRAVVNAYGPDSVER